VLRPIHWLGSSLDDIRAMPEAARRDIGVELTLVQGGDLPTDWKPIRGVGAGVMEIRVHRPGEFRVIYVAKFAEAVYVLHAFGKKSQKTPKTDLDLAKRRYAQMLALRRAKP
jgi:phage-related protein